MFALKDLAAQLGVANLDCRGLNEAFDPTMGRAAYVFNTTIAGIDAADAILIIGSNPRLEAPVLNARIRHRWRQGGVAIGVIGAQAPLTYDATYIGAGTQSLVDVASGTHAFAKVLAEAKRPMVIVGAGAFARADAAVVMALAARIAEAARVGADPGWAVFNVLHSAAARVAGLDLGVVPGSGGLSTSAMVAAAGKGELDVVWLLGADEIDMSALGNAFVVYQGTHGDAGAHRADVILPGAAYTEKSATFVNTEGRAQMTARAVFPPGEAKEDWTILRALSARVGRTLGYDTLPQLRAQMYKTAPQLARIDAPHAGEGEAAALSKLGSPGGMADATAFAPTIADFYLTNPIARASVVMAELSALRKAVGESRGLNAAE